MNIYRSLLASAEAVLALLLLRGLGVLNNGKRVLLASVLTAFAFSLRIICLDYKTLDYLNFLTRWVDYFREHGGFAALRYPVGNYNIPYLYFLALFSYFECSDLYLIKLLSIFFDVLLAYSASRLLGRLTDSIPRRFGCFFTVLFLPTVIMNGALWGQCDSSYAALAILGLCLALEDRPTGSMVCMALSFGFKLQAVFLLPVCVVLWLHGKYRWKHFLIFPLTYVLLVLPAVIAGRPFWETVTLYFSQTGSIGDGLNYNSPSVFSFFYFNKNSFISTASVFAAFFYMLALLFSALKHRRELNTRAVLGYAVLLVIGIPFLLPHMHERYFFLADILTLVMGFASFAALPAAALTEFASYIGYYAYLNMRFLLPMRHGGRALILSAVIAGFFTASALSGEKKNFFEKALDKLR